MGNSVYISLLSLGLLPSHLPSVFAARSLSLSLVSLVHIKIFFEIFDVTVYLFWHGFSAPGFLYRSSKKFLKVILLAAVTVTKSIAIPKQPSVCLSGDSPNA
jgi:hypothetical protein